MHNYKKLKIWENARHFVKDVYHIPAQFPKNEQYGLTSQIRRASVSIILNIAEGSGFTDKKFKQFLRMSISSAFEVETLLVLALDLKLINDKDFHYLEVKVTELQKMIFGFMKTLKIE